MMSYRLIIPGALFSLLVLQSGWAQENQITPPPALKPAIVSAEPNGFFSVNAIRGSIEDAANESICDVLISEGDVDNRTECSAKIIARSGSVKWASGFRPTECGHKCIKAPILKTTKHLDIPNSRFVAIDGFIKLHADVFLLPDRSIRIPVTVNYRCSQSAIGSGNRIMTDVVVGRPVVGDPSTFEKIVDLVAFPLNLSSYISSRIESGLPGESTTEGMRLSPCRSIGIDPNSDGRPVRDGIAWDNPASSPFAQPVAPLETISVRIRNIKRLNNDSALSEDDVHFYIYTTVGAARVPKIGNLTIAPGETKAVDVTIKAAPPEHEQLQIIVADSLGAAAWSQFSKNRRYGKGNGRKLLPARKELRPVQPPATKPTTVTVRDWEVTYDILYHRGGLLHN